MSSISTQYIVNQLKRGKVLFWLSVTFMLILPFNSDNIGFSDGEVAQWDYGQAALKYYQTFGQDTTFENPQRYDKMFRKGGLKHKGAAFFMTYSLGSKLLPDIPPRDVRHFLTAIVGLICMVFTGLIAKETTNEWRAGIIALWLIFLTPYFVGHSLVNDKDIPTAATMAMGIYFIIRLVKGLPQLSYKNLIGFGVATGLAIGIRIGGLLLVPYLFLFFGMAYLLDPEKRRRYLFYNRLPLFKNIGWLLVASVGGFLLGALFYPYVLSGNLFVRMWEIFARANDFPLNVTQVFEGKLMKSRQFPWYFHTKHLMITIPVIVWVLFLAFLPVYYFFARRKLKPIYAFILLFATIFPEAYINYTGANVYGEWRHILFIYPTFVATSGLTVHYLMDMWKTIYWKALIVVGLIFCLAKPAIWMIKNHPYEYVYANMLVGWYQGSYADYPGDVYRLGTLESYQWLNKYVRKNEKKYPLQVVSNDGFVMRYLTRHQRDTFKVSRSGYKALCFKDWDYAIMGMIFLRPELREKMYPPPKTIYTVDVENQPISAVIKRPTHAKRGFHLYQNKKFEKSFKHFRKAYQQHPENMCTWFYLGKLYMKMGQFDKSLKFLKKYNNYFSNNLPTKAALGDVHYRKGNYKKARRLYYLLLKNDVNFVKKFKLNYLIANCFYQTNNYRKAMVFVNRSLKQKSGFKPARQLKKKIKKKQS